MNENMRGYYNDEKEVDLMDLMFYLLKQWKTLVLAIIIGVLAGGGIYMAKRSASAEELSALEEDAEDYEIDPNVEANMELAFQYRQLYGKQLKYNQESVIMQLNPNAIYSGEMRFYLSAGYNTGLLGVLYQNILNDVELLKELKTASGIACRTNRVKELVGSYISQDNDSFINVNGMETPEEDSEDVVRHSFVVFTVISESEDACRDMLQVIEKKVEELDQRFKESNENYSFFEVNRAVRLVTDNSYLNRQRESIDLLSTYLSNVQRLESSFTEDDLAYYNKVFLEKEEKQENDETGALGSAGLNEEKKAENPLKWLIIGIFLGCVCWGGCYLIKYLLDKHIKTAEEVVSCYNLPLIGKFAVAGNEGRGLSGYLDRLHRGWKGKADADEYIVSTVNALDGRKILVCGDTKDTEIQNLMQILKDKCGRVESGGLLSRDVDMLKKTNTADGVILLVRVGYTTYSELQRELDVCWMRQIAVKGVVALDTF